MRENFASGSIPFRKAYLQSVTSVVEVDGTKIRIKGSILERAALALASRNRVVPGSRISDATRSRYPAWSREVFCDFVVRHGLGSQTEALQDFTVHFPFPLHRVLREQAVQCRFIA